MTPGEVFNIVFDTLVIDSGFWLRALSIAIGERKPGLSPDELAALDILISWDGVALPDRFGPAMYQTWREACDQAGRSIDDRSITTRAGLSSETKRHLIEALRVATKQQKKRYGHLDVRWREVHRSRRGEKSWGLPGLNSGNLKTLRRIRTKSQNVVAYGTHGQSAPTVMVFGSSGVKSFSAVPFGQSDQLDSPHNWDQAEVLFNQPRLKPTRFDTKPKDLTKKEVIRLPDNLFSKPD
jgi:acyl-homoserine lactone acylase PvdQ